MHGPRAEAVFGRVQQHQRQIASHARQERNPGRRCSRFNVESRAKLFETTPTSRGPAVPTAHGEEGHLAHNVEKRGRRRKGRSSVQEGALRHGTILQNASSAQHCPRAGQGVHGLKSVHIRLRHVPQRIFCGSQHRRQKEGGTRRRHHGKVVLCGMQRTSPSKRSFAGWKHRILLKRHARLLQVRRSFRLASPFAPPRRSPLPRRTCGRPTNFNREAIECDVCRAYNAPEAADKREANKHKCWFLNCKKNATTSFLTVPPEGVDDERDGGQWETCWACGLHTLPDHLTTCPIASETVRPLWWRWTRGGT